MLISPSDMMRDGDGGVNILGTLRDAFTIELTVNEGIEIMAMEARKPGLEAADKVRENVP
jgi:hypothetical protein